MDGETSATCPVCKNLVLRKDDDMDSSLIMAKTDTDEMNPEGHDKSSSRHGRRGRRRSGSRRKSTKRRGRHTKKSYSRGHHRRGRKSSA